MSRKSGVGKRQAKYRTLPWLPRSMSCPNAVLTSAAVTGMTCKLGPPAGEAARFRRLHPAKRSKAFAAVSSREVPSSIAAEGKALPPEWVVTVNAVESSWTMTATRRG